MKVVRTPSGVYCEGCLTLWQVLHSRDVFTLDPDDAVDEYPICDTCGRRHEDVTLSPLGERYQSELVGPRLGDVLLTHAGPANALLELSLVEESVVGVFRPDQREFLRQWIRQYQHDHPDAVVWELEDQGVPTLSSRWETPGATYDSVVFVNQAA